MPSRPGSTHALSSHHGCLLPTFRKTLTYVDVQKTFLEYSPAREQSRRVLPRRLGPLFISSQPAESARKLARPKHLLPNNAS